MMTSSNGNLFRVTGSLCGEFTGQRWMPLTKASDAGLGYILCSAPPKNGSVNSRGDVYLRHNRTHYDVNVVRENLPRLHCDHWFFLLQGHIRSLKSLRGLFPFCGSDQPTGSWTSRWGEAESQSGTHTNVAGKNHTPWSKIKSTFMRFKNEKKERK